MPAPRGAARARGSGVAPGLAWLLASGLCDHLESRRASRSSRPSQISLTSLRPLVAKSDNKTDLKWPSTAL